VRAVRLIARGSTLDGPRREAQTGVVAEPRQPRRLFIEDVRGNERYLRTTWHPEGTTFVISTWDGDVCTGAVRMSPEDAARLVAHLAGALADGTTVRLDGRETA